MGLGRDFILVQEYSLFWKERGGGSLADPVQARVPIGFIQVFNLSRDIMKKSVPPWVLFYGRFQRYNIFFSLHE